MKKIFAAAMAAFVLALAGCEKAEEERIDNISEATASETVSESETEVTEASETAETTAETTTETVTETESNVETVIIAGQEFPVDATDVVIYITNDFELTTDISEIGKLKNLESLSITNITDGGPYAVDGFKELEGCETLESIYWAIGFANDDDIYVLETLPNLKSLWLYGTYKDFEFNIPSLKELYLNGTYDLSKIEHLTDLEDLYLEYNNGDDLSPIAKLKGLKGLKIEECYFEDYSSILELENLEALWISSRPMTEEMYNKICEKFPDCKITIINDFID